MSNPAVFDGWSHIASGKVRDIYAPTSGPQDRLLVVTSDRISAFDFVLPSVIPDKGKVLTKLTNWWFSQISDIVPNHLLSEPVPSAVEGRAVIVRRLNMYPVECVARAYLTGSGLAEYRQSSSVCGVALPPGLTEASRLPEPIYTPAAKAQVGEHDENVSFERTVQMVGEDAATALKETTLAVFARASSVAAQAGIILADTKFEFGAHPETGELVLADEVLTPDSSRFWPADQWREGQVTPSFDKQFVRNWLNSAESGWDRGSGEQPPALPPEVVDRTRDRYIEAYERLTGEKF
ncbi:MAG: phosphoribosylaminoimidazolesuccinocarboxamide synthase [Actinomycetaceae bacterium]|nr:phosphoribosylaminoimidazolesuccinocarboxamide synthase [Actinomycetaceae bacterium]